MTAGAAAPTLAWRISNYADLSGLGGTLVGGRWHTKGRPIVYCALTPAGALLEHLVHLDIDDLPATYTLLRIEISAPALIEKAAPEGEWRADVAATRAIGDRWLAAGASLALRVPSVVMPQACNLLINPAHPDIARARIAAVEAVPYDPRLVRD